MNINEQTAEKIAIALEQEGAFGQQTFARSYNVRIIARTLEEIARLDPDCPHCTCTCVGCEGCGTARQFSKRRLVPKDAPEIASSGPDECPHGDKDWPMRRCRDCGAKLYETTAGVIRVDRRAEIASKPEPVRDFAAWYMTTPLAAQSNPMVRHAAQEAWHAALAEHSRGERTERVEAHRLLDELIDIRADSARGRLRFADFERVERALKDATVTAAVEQEAVAEPPDYGSHVCKGTGRTRPYAAELCGNSGCWPHASEPTTPEPTCRVVNREAMPTDALGRDHRSIGAPDVDSRTTPDAARRCRGREPAPARRTARIHPNRGEQIAMSEQLRIPLCNGCGLPVADGELIYFRIWPFPRYRHAQHGPFADIPQPPHGAFDHTPRCNTGGCRE